MAAKGTLFQRMADLSRDQGKPCAHPSAHIGIVDYGLSIACTACGLKRRLERKQIDLLMAEKAGASEYLSPAAMEPSLESVAMQASRLDFALRAMGRAFWRVEQTPAMETAMELAKDAVDGFAKMRPNMKAMLDRAIAAFPQAEPVAEGAH